MAMKELKQIQGNINLIADLLKDSSEKHREPLTRLLSNYLRAKRRLLSNLGLEAQNKDAPSQRRLGASIQMNSASKPGNCLRAS
jgi:hypothetical protein